MADKDMIIYYYSAADSFCDGSCDYATCNKRCLSHLASLPPRYTIRTIPEGSCLSTPMTMELRSGDIIIVYAKDEQEMKTLVLNSDVFDRFRIILVVGTEELIKRGYHHRLKPRFTTVLDHSLERLSAVLQRMTTHGFSQNEHLPQQEQNHA